LLRLRRCDPGAGEGDARRRALAYCVLPLDAVPDVLPGVGLTDDAAVLLTSLRMVDGHLRPEHHAAARVALARVQAGGAGADSSQGP
jgi:uncharacterized membrane protein YkvA (DUF1232 family)